MRIRHLNFSDSSGGAARAAARLSEGLRRIGFDSKLIVRERIGDESTSIQVATAIDVGGQTTGRNLLRRAQDRVVRGRTPLSNTVFSLDGSGIDLSGSREILIADVVHLHWTSYFLSPYTISRLARFDTPLVWTLHDQWPFTGGCHFSSGCDEFAAACGNCPQLIPEYQALASLMQAEKLATYANSEISLIAPSQWMANCAQRSSIFRDRKVEVIPNGIDTKAFRPGDKQEARLKLGLPNDKFIVLLGAEGGREKRKGFDVVAEALRRTRLSPRQKREVDIHVVCFGRLLPGMLRVGLPVHSLGVISGNERLRLAYCAADLYVLPSREDNLPNTLLESMACGTPVLAADCGGNPDLVMDSVNGLLASTADPGSFCDKLLKVKRAPELVRSMGADARDMIVRRFSLEAIAFRHADLYRTLLKGVRTDTISTSSRCFFAVEVPGSPDLISNSRFRAVIEENRSFLPQTISDVCKAIAVIRERGLRHLLAYGWLRGSRVLGEGNRSALCTNSRVALGMGFELPKLRIWNGGSRPIAWITSKQATLLVERQAVTSYCRLEFFGNGIRASISNEMDEIILDLPNLANKSAVGYLVASIEIAPGLGWSEIALHIEGDAALHDSSFGLTSIDITP